MNKYIRPYWKTTGKERELRNKQLKLIPPLLFFCLPGYLLMFPLVFIWAEGNYTDGIDLLAFGLGILIDNQANSYIITQVILLLTVILFIVSIKPIVKNFKEYYKINNELKKLVDTMISENKYDKMNKTNFKISPLEVNHEEKYNEFLNELEKVRPNTTLPINQLARVLKIDREIVIKYLITIQNEAKDYGEYIKLEDAFVTKENILNLHDDIDNLINKFDKFQSLKM